MARRKKIKTEKTRIQKKEKKKKETTSQLLASLARPGLVWDGLIIFVVLTAWGVEQIDTHSESEARRR